MGLPPKYNDSAEGCIWSPAVILNPALLAKSPGVNPNDLKDAGLPFRITVTGWRRKKVVKASPARKRIELKIIPFLLFTVTLYQNSIIEN
jgi:hypothetical protein